MSQSEAKLIYVGDPMCSWCYGIAPELEKLQEDLEDDITLEIVMGGLRPYNTQKMIELKSFLTHHWEDVNKASGQEFNYGILDDTELVYDTEPPSRALIAVRNMDESKAMRFFFEIQELFYLKNKNMFLVETYEDIINGMGLDYNTFKEHFESEELKRQTKKDFLRASEYGVRSFPTLLLIEGDKRNIIAQGYTKAESMLKLIHHTRNN